MPLATVCLAIREEQGDLDQHTLTFVALLHCVNRRSHGKQPTTVLLPPGRCR